jgi:hypothetical protein
MTNRLILYLGLDHFMKKQTNTTNVCMGPSSLAKGYDPFYSSSPLGSRKEMKSSRRLAENDIITRGVTVKIQQVAVRGNYENPTDDAKGEDDGLIT